MSTHNNIFFLVSNGIVPILKLFIEYYNRYECMYLILISTFT